MQFNDWRKSTRSNAEGNCVEVGAGREGVGVRDTKDQGQGPVLTLSPGDWMRFLGTIK